MAAQKVSNLATVRYRQYGSKRPSSHNLESMIASIERYGEPSILCTLASMCIDLAAANPDKAEPTLDKAQDALMDALEMSKHFSTESSFDRSAQRVGEYAISAHLMLAGMENWRLAVVGRPVTNGFDALLSHMVDATAYANPGQLHGRAKLAEAVPLLLGLRRQVRTGGEQGWHGRMALVREDQRDGLTNAPGENKSWDVSAVPGGSLDAFVAPDRRIQVKLSSVDPVAARLYRSAGVIPVSARTLGFGDPTKIVLSCAREMDGCGPENTFGSAELDTITDRLEAAIGIDGQYPPVD